MKRNIHAAVFLIALFAAITASAQDGKPQPALPAAPADIPSGPNAVGIRFWVYRIRGDVSGETSLTEAIWEGAEGDKTNAHQGPYVFFTRAKLAIAGVSFQAGQNGWKWDGKDEPPSGHVEKIAAPRIIVTMPNDFCFQVGSEVPVQYFRKRTDGLFELELSYQSVGLTVTARVEKGNGNADMVLLRDFSIGTNLIEKRKPIEGVSLDVGEPVVSAREEKVTFAVKPGLDYGIQFCSEGSGTLLVRLKLDRAAKQSLAR